MVCGIVLRGDLLAVHLQHAGAALAEAGAIVGEVEHEGVLARRERLLAFPAEPREIQEVVGEHRLALQQVEAVAAEAAASVTIMPSPPPSGTSTSAVIV